MISARRGFFVRGDLRTRKLAEKPVNRGKSGKNRSLRPFFLGFSLLFARRALRDPALACNVARQTDLHHGSQA